MIVKLFSAPFAAIGIVYAVIGFTMVLLGAARHRRLMHDFADQHYPGPSAHARSGSDARDAPRVWGRDFRTAGDSVLLMVFLVFALEVSVIVLLTRL